MAGIIETLHDKTLAKFDGDPVAANEFLKSPKSNAYIMNQSITAAASTAPGAMGNVAIMSTVQSWLKTPFPVPVVVPPVVPPVISPAVTSPIIKVISNGGGTVVTDHHQKPDYDHHNNPYKPITGAPTYSLSKSAVSVNEGGSVTVTLATTYVADGTLVPYTISGTGITSADINGAPLTGNFTVHIDHDSISLRRSTTSSLVLNITSDALTEGVETLTVTCKGQVISFNINDISITTNPTYSLFKSAVSVDEGSSVTVTLITTNVTNGTTVPYVISGVSTADINGAPLTGNFTVSGNTASLVLTTTADGLTEGAETLTVTCQGQAVGFNINDTSLTAIVIGPIVVDPPTPTHYTPPPVTYETVTDITYTTENSSTISDSLIPFMRQESILYKGTGFKPTTTYNCFFDGVDVTTQITPAQELLVSAVVGQGFVFDIKTNVGGINSETRTIVNNPVVALNVGDVITGATSAATGVLVGIEIAVDNKLKLFVANVVGTFSSSEVVTGSISAAKGTIQSIITRTVGEPISSVYGNLYGIFLLPNTSNLKFNVGTRKLLFSTGVGTDITSDSFGSADFVSSGTLHSVQPVVTTIRHETTRQVANPPVVVTPLPLPRIIISPPPTKRIDDVIVTPTPEVLKPIVKARVEELHLHGRDLAREVRSIFARTTVKRQDPLAETFFVEEETGIFLTSIDLFFASKDETLPVFVSIINTVNGYPGNVEIELSKVTVNAYDVNVSTNKSITADKAEWPSPDNPTRVTFKAPVYLEGKTEYAIFIRSDSFKYRMWTSYLGDSTVNGLGMTTSQPVMGSLFKSQNANTWTTDQNEDLCFKLYRAKFDTSVTANIPLKNTPSILFSGLYNKIEVKTGSVLLRVYHRAHGFQIGHSVTIADLTASPVITSGGFTVGTRYVISNLTGTTQEQWNTAAGTSSLTYIVGSNFTAATVGAGTGTAEEANYFGYSSSQLNSSHLLSNIELDAYTITMPYVAPVSGIIKDKNIKFSFNTIIDNLQPLFTELLPINTQTKYVYAGTNTANVKSQNNINVGNYNTVDSTETLVILSPENETSFLSSGESSLTMGVELSSTDEYVSPMVDTHRMQLKTTGYKINNPSVNINIPTLDFNTIASSSSVITVDYLNNQYTTTNSAMKLLFLTIIVGQYVTVSGCSNSINNGTFLVTAVASDGTFITVSEELIVDTSTSISMLVGTRFFSEITPHGSSSVAKYVSMPLVFANVSTAFKLFFDYNLPSGCNIDFYYKISNSLDSSKHNDLTYAKIDFLRPLVVDNNNNNISAASAFVEGLFNFNTLSIKIVYNSSNSHRFPRMRDFRIVALA